MPSLRRPLRGLVCVAAVAFVMVGCAGESSSPQNVIRDFDWDGSVDGQWDAVFGIDVRHTVSDLERAGALMAVQNPGMLAAFTAETKVAIGQALLGKSPAKPAVQPGQPDVQHVDMPAWTIVAAGGAGLLVLGGVGSAVYRRSRRRVAEPRIT